MPPLEDTKEAFDWKQGAPSGTVLLPLQTYEDDNQLHLERFGFQIGCIDWCFHSMMQCSRIWECYAGIERQLLAAGQSVACGELASGDVTSGHPPSPRTV